MLRLRINTLTIGVTNAAIKNKRYSRGIMTGDLKEGSGYSDLNHFLMENICVKYCIIQKTYFILILKKLIITRTSKPIVTKTNSPNKNPILEKTIFICTVRQFYSLPGCYTDHCNRNECMKNLSRYRSVGLAMKER